MAHGRIINVVDRGFGSRLVGDLASGATVVPVDDVFLFNEAENDSGDPIGQLQIGDEVYDYISTDDDESTITLATATTEDYTDQDWVFVAPATSEKYAIVELDGGGSTEFLIPFLLWAWVEESTRGTLVGEYVRLSWDGQQYVYENLLGAAKKLDGSVIDPVSTIPTGALTDKQPPDTAPTGVATIGGLNQIFLKWNPITNPDPVKYDIHVSDSAGFTPDDTNLLVKGASGSVVPAKMLADGTPFNYDDTYYFQIVPTDADGAGPASAEVSGQMNRTGTNDIVVGSITAELLEAVLVIVNLFATANPALGTQRIEIDTDGIRSYDPSGNLLVEWSSATGLMSWKSAAAGARVELDSSGLTALTDYPIPVRTITGVTAARAAIAGDYVFILNGSTGAMHKFNMTTGEESLSGFPKAGPYSSIASDGTNVFTVSTTTADIQSYDATTGTEDLTGFPIVGTFSYVAASGGRLFAVDSAADIRSYDAATGVQDTTNFPKVGTYTWLAADGGRLFAVDTALDIHSFNALTGVEDVVNFPLVGTFGRIAAGNGVLYALIGSPVAAFDAITAVQDTTKFPLDVGSSGGFVAVRGDYLVADGSEQSLRVFNAGADFPSVRIDSEDGSAELHETSVSDLHVAGDVDVSGLMDIAGDAEIPHLQVYSTKYTRGSTQSIPNNTATKVTYTANSGTAPADAGLSESAGTVTVAQDGVYRVTARVIWAANADSTRRSITITAGAATIVDARPALNHASLTTSQTVSDDFHLTAGQTIDVQVVQTIASGALNINVAGLTITRIGDLAA